LQANTLIVQLTWLHQPLLPGVRQLMRQLAPNDNRYGSLAMSRAGYLPLQREISMVMQSHPVAWSMPGHQRVTRANHPTEPEREETSGSSVRWDTSGGAEKQD